MAGGQTPEPKRGRSRSRGDNKSSKRGKAAAPKTKSKKGAASAVPHGPCRICGLIFEDMPENHPYCFEHKREVGALDDQLRKKMKATGSEEDKKNYALFCTERDTHLDLLVRTFCFWITIFLHDPKMLQK